MFTSSRSCKKTHYKCQTDIIYHSHYVPHSIWENSGQNRVTLNNALNYEMQAPNPNPNPSPLAKQSDKLKLDKNRGGFVGF